MDNLNKQLQLGQRVMTNYFDEGIIVGFGESVGWLKVRLNTGEYEDFMSKDLHSLDRIQIHATDLFKALSKVKPILDKALRKAPEGSKHDSYADQLSEAIFQATDAMDRATNINYPVKQAEQ